MIYERGYGWLFARHVQQADKGCDFDFLHRDAGALCRNRRSTKSARAQLAETAPWDYLQIMDLLERITFDPEQCGGRPCIRHTRFRVIDLLELLAAGASRDEILADYPFLEPDDVKAGLLYAARLADHTVLAAA